MNFAEMSVAVGTILFLTFLFFQIAVPLWTNKPLFPMFRGNRRKLKAALRDARGTLDEQRIARELDSTRAKATPAAPKPESGGPQS
ncbi:MAG: hypothetical protein ABSF56_00690 [Minisyncoccia bacterium]|jgi:hypothetical protein